MTEIQTITLQEENPDLPVLSYSQLQVWDRCEYAWHMNYERKLVRKATSNSGTLGLRIHYLLETFFRSLQETNNNWSVSIETVEESLAKMTNEAFILNQPSEVVNEIARAGKVVLMFLRKVAPLWYDRVVILDVEKHFEIILETPKGYKFILQGYIDLLTAKDGKVTIEDHKSTSNASFWKPNEVLMDPQMTIYLWAFRLLGIPVDGITYNFFNTYDYKKGIPEPDKLFKRDGTYRSEKEIENFAFELLTEVERLIEASQDNNYKYRRSLRRDCANCAYQKPCLYALKGIDPEPILLADFEIKGSRK